MMKWEKKGSNKMEDEDGREFKWESGERSWVRSIEELDSKLEWQNEVRKLVEQIKRKSRVRN